MGGVEFAKTGGILPGRQVYETRETAPPSVQPAKAVAAPEDAYLSAPSQAGIDLYANPVSLSTTRDDDLIVPRTLQQTFERMVNRVSQHERIQKEWSFASQGGNSPSLVFLIVGNAGHGKSTATRVLAKRLERPLYQLDLSRVIGSNASETMNRLTAAFKAAEEAKVILHIPHSDLLFTSTREHDAQEVNQRLISAHAQSLLERHRGVVVLTSLADTGGGGVAEVNDLVAEKLRLQYPDVSERIAIWKRALPNAAPQSGIDFEALGTHLQMTGGEIASIVRTAAAIAAGQEQPIAIEHIREAVQAESQKSHRTLTSTAAAVLNRPSPTN